MTFTDLRKPTTRLQAEPGGFLIGRLKTRKFFPLPPCSAARLSHGGHSGKGGGDDTHDIRLSCEKCARFWPPNPPLALVGGAGVRAQLGGCWSCAFARIYIPTPSDLSPSSHPFTSTRSHPHTSHIHSQPHTPSRKTQNSQRKMACNCSSNNKRHLHLRPRHVQVQRLHRCLCLQSQEELQVRWQRAKSAPALRDVLSAIAAKRSRAGRSGGFDGEEGW